MVQNGSRKQKIAAKGKQAAAAAGPSRAVEKRAALGGIVLALTIVFISAIPAFDGHPGTTFESVRGIAGRGALAAAVLSLYCVYLVMFHRDVLSTPRRWFRMVLLGVLFILSGQLVLEIGLPAYVMPVPFFALLFALTGGRRFGLATLFVLSVLCMLIPGVDPSPLFVMLVGGAVVVLGSVPISSRWKLMQIGVVVAFSNCVVLVGFWLCSAVGFSGLSTQIMWSCLAGFAYVGILANACLPLIEYLFQVTTHMTLLELSSQSHPLLKRLVLEAPGTYHHSLVVGNLAEAAAEAIGCDWLLARVGSYYHDIGKLEKPLYFTENTTNMPDRHESLSPAMSSLVITAHPKDGVQMGLDYALPKDIIDFVEQHHGKSVVEFFYNEAMLRAGEDDKPSPESFRYAGPRPKNKEVGIVMLADSVEAATRSLSEPTSARIESLVHDIVFKRIVNGELDECPLTLDDTRKACESFARVLTGMYHSRVKYPETVQEGNSGKGGKGGNGGKDSRDNRQANGSEG